MTHKTILDKITNRVQIQSGILNTITRNNDVRNAHMKDIEGRLTDSDACLTGLCNTTEATTSSLRTDINNVRVRLILDLRRNIKCEINEALARIPSTNAAGALPLEADDHTRPEGASVPTGEVPPTTMARPHFLAQAASTSEANATNASPEAMLTHTPGCQDQLPSGSPTPAGLGGTPTRHGHPTSWSTSSWFPPGNCGQTVTPGDDHPSHDQHPPGYRSCPPPLDAAVAESSGSHKLGGPIISPHASDREQLARTLKTSRYDIATLATSKYHGKEDGVRVLTELYIHDCRYTSFLLESPEDILICYWDIIMIHQKVVDDWVNHRSGWSSPSVEYILEKALLHFLMLMSLDAREMVKFYNKLQKLSMGYLLPLMPFDTIKLSFNFEGLCPLGLGMLRCAEIGSALMEVLPCLLPATMSDVHSAITTVAFESNNGYDLLWQNLELAVPGFDLTAPILPPIWHWDSNVFKFCHAHLLYFCLQAKKNNYFDARMCTSIFLRAISTSEYANVVTLLQTQVDSYRNPDDDGFLPHNFWLNGIATLINNNAKARIWDFATPRIHQVDGADTNWDVLDEEEHPFCHVQGYTPRALRLEQGRDRLYQGRN